MPNESEVKPGPAPEKTAGSTVGQYIREGMTSVISLVILALATYFLVDTYLIAKTVITGANAQEAKDAYTRQKDLLLYALGLLGTVMGYYLGRVPAELHAQAAQKNAERADAKATQAQSDEAATKATVKSGLRQIKGMIGGPQPGEPVPKGFASPALKAIDDLLDDVT